MKNIIAYSAEKLYRDFEKADELFLSSRMKDMELYEKQLAEATRKAAAEHMAALYTDMDRMLCEDISRAEKYTIQRHDERQLLTTVGPVRFTHTLFRSHKQEEATGTEGISVRPNRGYMRSLLLHHHANDRVYIEKMQATIPSIDIRKKLAIRERLGGI